MGPNVQKAMPFGSPPYQGLKKCGLSKKKVFFYFSTFFWAHWGDFCGFRAAGHILWLAYFLTVPAAPGRLNPALVPGKTHTSERSVLWSRYGHIHRYRGQIHTCSPGRLQGHLWVILTIGSCFYGSFWLFSVLGSGLLPHTRSKTLKTTVFLTQNTTFWPMKGKKIKKIDIL